MSDSATRPHILVVEDDPDLLRMLSRMLSAFGEVQTATDGRQALEQLHGGLRPALVITDVMMPRLDGLSLVRAMKDDPQLASIPVLMLTARDQPRDVAEGIGTGVRSYITKPFKTADLLKKVRRALKLD